MNEKLEALREVLAVFAHTDIIRIDLARDYVRVRTAREDFCEDTLDKALLALKRALSAQLNKYIEEKQRELSKALEVKTKLEQ